MMTKTVMNNSDLHFEHMQWRSELSFWKDELKTFNNRLEELVVRWTDKDVLVQLEHYQNSFILHKEVIDTLQHEINVHETNMSKHVANGEDIINQPLAENHWSFREKMETQREIYADLKKDFFSF